MPEFTGVVVTCEHGGNRIPRPYAEAFADYGALLASHRGWDPGALELARRFARSLKTPMIATTISRMLVEVNRSLNRGRAFSTMTRALPKSEREDIVNRYYTSHRDRVKDALRIARTTCGSVLHLGVHSFTPVLAGKKRNADIGLLYDPRRPREVEFCKLWQRAIGELDDSLVVRRNYPYRGTSDGLTTDLRRELGPRYLGIELEVNQRFPLTDPNGWHRLQRLLVQSLKTVL